MDEIILTENQQVSAVREAPECLDSDYYDNDSYQVNKIIIEETKEKFEWRKREFEYEQNNKYWVENLNDMMRIHNNEVKNISECSLLHDIINPLKLAKNLNDHYSNRTTKT